MSEETITLWRPVGPAELELIRAAGMRAFPPRLPEQPIFYPVLSEEYAVKIARDWNVPARRVCCSKLGATSLGFPPGMTPDLPVHALEASPEARAVAAAAAELDRLRSAWLNPPDLVRAEPEVVAGYPDRLLPRDESAAAALAKRTLTNLYNARPAWLANAHAALDAAVAAAYGWPADITADDALERLLALNLERAEAQKE